VQGSHINWSAWLRALPVHIVTPDTKFEKVLQALSVHKLHRMYVLDHAEHSIGIITLTDILRLLLPKVQELPSEGPAAGLPHSSEMAGDVEGAEDAEMVT
jgi:CBS domain containing-hemolysin-like protein